MADYDPRWADAISSIESSGDYNQVTPSPGGRAAYGKYQVMGENIPDWTQAALGKSMTPQEFVANPDAQDAVFKHRFGGYVDQYGSPQDAASAWFTGRPINAQSAGASDKFGTTGASYVAKFNKALGSSDGAAQPTPPTAGILNTASATAPTGKPGMLNGGMPDATEEPDLTNVLAKALPPIQQQQVAALPPIRFVAPKGYDRAKFLAALTARKTA